MAVISAHCRIVPFIIGILFAQEPIASQLYVEIKWQLDATDEFLLQILLRAQHVPGNIMPIIRSSRILYKWLLPVVFGAWFSSLSVWCGAEGCVSGIDGMYLHTYLRTPWIRVLFEN